MLQIHKKKHFVYMQNLMQYRFFKKSDIQFTPEGRFRVREKGSVVLPSSKLATLEARLWPLTLLLDKSTLALFRLSDMGQEV